jgi:Xaa-Pro aminopeptidase
MPEQEVRAMASRREFLNRSAAATLAPAAMASSENVAAADPREPTIRPRLADLAFLGREALLNRERAQAIFAAEGFDALVVARGANVYYATNFHPLTERQIGLPTCLAVIPRDARRPVALVVGHFSYYYVLADDGLPPGVLAITFTSPAEPSAAPRKTADGADGAGGDEPDASAPALFRIVDPARVTPREQRRRRASEAAAPYSPDMQRALARALRELGITGGRIGVDDPLAERMLAVAAPRAQTAPAEDTLRRVRFVRTPAEVRLMRIATQNNAEAAMVTARTVRELGSLRAVRAHFFAECARRGNTGVFMVVDGAASDAYEEPLREGQSLMIDCVSHLRGYHGDYARTIHIGEPSKRMALTTEAIGKAWDEIRSRLKPGLKFSAIRAIGNDTLRELGSDVTVAFTPHSVGLFHGDQPRAAPDGGPIDHTLEAGMILSVDCPTFDTGIGGTAHFEDLVLIRPDGVELLHESGPRTYTV